MKNTVTLWESETLALHLIRTDLMYTKLLIDTNSFHQKQLNQLTVIDCISWLLGVFDDYSRTNILAYYKTERNQVAKKSAIAFETVAREIYFQLKRRTEYTYPQYVHERYIEQYDVREGLRQAIVSLIKNDLVRLRFLHEHPDISTLDGSERWLIEPAVWMMGVWDRRLQEELLDYYWRLSAWAVQLELGHLHYEAQDLAEEIHRKLTEKKEKLNFFKYSILRNSL